MRLVGIRLGRVFSLVVYILVTFAAPFEVARVVVQQFTRVAPEYSHEDKARVGPRSRRIQDDGRTLGACRQIKYLVRTIAPRGGS